MHRQTRLNFAGSIERMSEAKCFAAFLRTLFRQDWVVYTKPAFGGPEQVLRYLGRYTHRVAIRITDWSPSMATTSRSVGGITLALISSD